MFEGIYIHSKKFNKLWNETLDLILSEYYKNTKAAQQPGVALFKL